MNRDEVLIVVVEILQELQASLGEEAEEIDDMTKPIGGLRKFDSLTGVEATVICLERFEIDDSKKIMSLFVGEDKEGRPYALTVGEIADRIMKLKKKRK